MKNNWETEIKKIKFDQSGLVPAVVQDNETGEVLMVAYMNEEALRRTIETERSWFWSRSRQEYWQKGATSGNIQLVQDIRYDCDTDTILLLVKQVGVACHTGEKSCFFQSFFKKEYEKSWLPFFYKLQEVIKKRQIELPEGSYTASLLKKGWTKIEEKLKEELEEFIEASQNEPKERKIAEAADFCYHLIVALTYLGISLEDVERELCKRHR
jgi:phosphoribosyl-ATP pyrophosphohydrolase/phosphoribosyl-AMP cyclohydrolase